MGVAKERLPSMMVLLMRPGVHEDVHCVKPTVRASLAHQTLAVLPPPNISPYLPAVICPRTKKQDVSSLNPLMCLCPKFFYFFFRAVSRKFTKWLLFKLKVLRRYLNIGI
jgi:hypothetical protein